MAKAKLTGRGEDRPTTSTRVYVDTIVKLELLSDLDIISLSEAIDRLVVWSFARRKGELLRTIEALAGDRKKS